MITILIIVFALGYLAITLEHTIKINKFLNLEEDPEEQEYWNRMP